MKQRKLKRDEVPTYRSKLLRQQAGFCAICGQTVRLKDQALDHDHSTGRCRGVVHRDCNILLGKVENYISRHGKRMKTEGRVRHFLMHVWGYMESAYGHMPLHHTHKTAKDKLALKYRRLIRRSKKETTKDKYRALLRELTNE